MSSTILWIDGIKRKEEEASLHLLTVVLPICLHLSFQTVCRFAPLCSSTTSSQVHSKGFSPLNTSEMAVEINISSFKFTFPHILSGQHILLWPLGSHFTCADALAFCPKKPKNRNQIMSDLVVGLCPRQ